MEAEAPLPMSMPLPDAFIEFLNQNGLDPSIYDSTTIQSTPRYIRLKPSDGEDQIDDIEAEINCKLEKVNWLPGFFSIPPHIQIASTNAYREAKIYGMDAASGAAVSALNVSLGDHVLDLCAAPGAKLCMISELLGSGGSVTGVDVAKHRLAACRTMLQKYALGDHCRLFVADGTSFSLLPLRACCDLKSCDESGNKLNCTGKILLEETRDVFKEWSSKRSFKERKKASKERNDIGSHLVPRTQEPELIFYGRNSGVVGVGKRELFEAAFGSESSIPGYDKVLVDAECTHDGSIKHIQKFEHWGWKTLERRVLDAQRTDTLTHLQLHAQHPDVTKEWPKLQLLTNGFRLLKVGGSLVYSTCSLTVAQNEDVVEKFLSGNPFAGCLRPQAVNEIHYLHCHKKESCRKLELPRTGLVRVGEYRRHCALILCHPKLVGFSLLSSLNWQLNKVQPYSGGLEVDSFSIIAKIQQEEWLSVEETQRLFNFDQTRN